MGAAARILSERASRALRPANKILMDALLESMEEACRLANEGHTICALTIEGGRPVIQLERSAYLSALVETGKAAYCAFGIGGDGQRRRVGELLGRGGCRVMWIEVGN